MDGIKLLSEILTSSACLQDEQKKKMPTRETLPGIIGRNYMPAQLRQSKSMGYHIEFYLMNPLTGKMERQRIKLNRLKKRCKSKADFLIEAHTTINRINQALLGTTFSSCEFGISEQPQKEKTTESSILMSEAVARFLEEKKVELRETSFRSYRTFCKQFLSWLENCHKSLPCSLMTRQLAVSYMDFVYRGGNSASATSGRKAEGFVSPRTYNNNLKLARALSHWCVEKCYLEDDVFSHISAKKQRQKERITIPSDVRTVLSNYLKDHHPKYLIICELVYTSLLRPVEISRLQVGDVDIDNCCIHVPASKSKNHNSRDARLSSELCALLSQHIMFHNADEFLFAEGWTPGVKALSSHTYTNVWTRIREELHLPKQMQLYSLRDSGINELLRAGVDPLSVMQAADHHDLKMTTIYANHHNKNLINEVNKKAPNF